MCWPSTCSWLVDRCSYAKAHTWHVDLLSASLHLLSIVLMFFFCLTMFHHGMQKEKSTQWNRAVRCIQRKTKTTKNLLQIHISSTSFLNSGNLVIFHNELKSWTEELWNSKTDKKKRAHGKTETLEVFGSLCNVLLFWLHVKMLDFWKQPPTLLEYVAEYLWGRD